LTGLCCCLDSEPRFADTGLAENQYGMPFAGFGYPGDVLAKQIKLELPVDQRFLRALAACPVVSLPWSFRAGMASYPPRGAAARAPNESEAMI
jgi:hypothetical protein